LEKGAEKSKPRLCLARGGKLQRKVGFQKKTILTPGETKQPEGNWIEKVNEIPQRWPTKRRRRRVANRENIEGRGGDLQTWANTAQAYIEKHPSEEYKLEARALL